MERTRYSFFSDKEATGRMLSNNKEADQTVKTQHSPTGKTLTGFPSNANIYSIAYIPILDIVETRDIILLNNICDVQMHWYAG